MRLFWFALLAAAGSSAETAVREVVYPDAWYGGIAPLFDKGYLVYFREANGIEVFRPTGAVAFRRTLPCPGTGSCSYTGTAVDSAGHIAVSTGYWKPSGQSAAILILDATGNELRSIETFPYLATSLCFDRDDNLWTLGWQREPLTGSEEADYPLVRKFSRDGRQIGAYVPRSLWPSRKSRPGYAGRGYWTMYAASDRIGAMVHEGFGDHPAEWLQWDFNGNVVRRTMVPNELSLGRAYTADGRLYARFAVRDRPSPEVRVLDAATGTWEAVADNLPSDVQRDRAFLIGAQGLDLVYRVGPGTRLLWVRPGPQPNSASR